MSCVCGLADTQPASTLYGEGVPEVCGEGVVVDGELIGGEPLRDVQACRSSS